MWSCEGERTRNCRSAIGRGFVFELIISKPRSSIVSHEPNTIVNAPAGYLPVYRSLSIEANQQTTISKVNGLTAARIAVALIFSLPAKNERTNGEKIVLVGFFLPPSPPPSLAFSSVFRRLSTSADEDCRPPPQPRL